MTPTIGENELRAILDGLEGVTPGPWKYEGSIYENMGAGLRSIPDDRGFAQLWKSDHVALDAKHLARLDPDTVRSIISELLDVRASKPADGWKTIDGAPKDGTKILVGRFTKGIAADEHNGQVSVDYWHSRPKHDFEGWGRFNDHYWPATHWMPIPSVKSCLTSIGVEAGPKCHVQEYSKSDGTKDYFVAVSVGDRTLTPHMHRIRGRAEYEVAEWEWLLNGGQKPEFNDFDLDAPEVQP